MKSNQYNIETRQFNSRVSIPIPIANWNNIKYKPFIVHKKDYSWLNNSKEKGAH